MMCKVKNGDKETIEWGCESVIDSLKKGSRVKINYC